MREASLLPKLRDLFAEFLKEGSFVRLGSLLPIYLCWFTVRLSYFSLEVFPASMKFAASPCGSPSQFRLTGKRFFHLSHPCCLDASNQRSRQHILLFHPILQTKHGSTGILTRYPSATPFGLTLGPTYPGRTSLPQETLDLRRTRFSLVYALLKPTFSLRATPALLTVCLLCDTNALLPLHLAVKSAASVINLAPLHFRRRTTRPVSCYALFKG